MYNVKRKLLPSYLVDIFEENEMRYQLHNENAFIAISVRYGKQTLSKIPGSIFVV